MKTVEIDQLSEERDNAAHERNLEEIPSDLEPGVDYVFDEEMADGTVRQQTLRVSSMYFGIIEGKKTKIVAGTINLRAARRPLTEFKNIKRAEAKIVDDTAKEAMGLIDIDEFAPRR